VEVTAIEFVDEAPEVDSPAISFADERHGSGETFTTLVLVIFFVGTPSGENIRAPPQAQIVDDTLVYVVDLRDPADNGVKVGRQIYPRMCLTTINISAAIKQFAIVIIQNKQVYSETYNKYVWGRYEIR
jgi:hypothetical protein